MSYFAVIGNPVEHSLSPLIHQQFAARAGIALRYEKIVSEPDQFTETVRTFQSQHGTGMNVTHPFKTNALTLCDQLSHYAQKAGSVNTLHCRDDGTIKGHNTDGPGLILDLDNHNICVADKNILILGAGGAIRGILPAIITEQPEQLVVANRTKNKAQTLAKHFALEACDLQTIPNRLFDLVIHGTTLGRSHTPFSLPTITLKPGAVVYDLNYHPNTKCVAKWAGQLGAQYIDGLGMLVEQAALSFRIWHDHWPKTDDVIDMIRGQ